MVENNYAPICLFTYNRLAETKKTIEALQKNFLANESRLYIYSDAGRTKEDVNKVSKVRDYLRSISGFKSVKIFESLINKGLANSVITGVSKTLKSHNSVIVLEDDLVTSPNFLDFLNQSLKFYEDDNKIFSVSGYTLNLPSLPGDNDCYFGYRASSWGWGIWSNRWQVIDWDVADYEKFKRNKISQKKFRRGGSDLPRMLSNQMSGRIDSWAIRFCYHQFCNNLITVFPTSSKLISIGFSNEATNTFGSKRFHTPIDKELKRDFCFTKFNKINPKIINEFASKFSIKNRIYNQFRILLIKSINFMSNQISK